MKQKRIVKWITSFLLILLMFVGFGSTLTHAKDAPKTDVVITKVETKDKAKDMTLDQLANGVNVADYFTDGKVIPGVSFTYYSVSQAQLDTMMENPGNYDTVAKVEAFVGGSGTTTAETDSAGQVTLSNLPEGYYWVVENTKSTIASSTAVPFGLTLPFTNMSGDGYLEKIYVYPKNTLEGLPDIDKDVNGGDSSNVAIGELNTWNVLIDIPAGIADYKAFGFIDEIDSRLDFEGTNSVTAFAEGIDLVKGVDYIVEFNDTPGQIGQYGSLAGKTLTGILNVHFTEVGREKLAQATSEVVTISFNTRVNDTAIMGLDIYNNVVLEYDNGHGSVSDPDRDTPPEEPYVYTGGKAFVKYDGVSEEKLGGAEFKVRNDNGEFVQVGEGGAITFGSENEATIFTSDSEGKFEVKGLPYGDYVLVETKAPDGYILPTNPETDFVVDATSYYLDPTVIEIGSTPSDNPQAVINKK